MATSALAVRRNDSSPNTASEEKAWLEDVVETLVRGEEAGTYIRPRVNDVSAVTVGQGVTGSVPVDVFPPLRQAHKTRFLPLNEWEGVVESINVADGTFFARVDDLTDPSIPQEIGDCFLEDIRQDDLVLLRSGAIFRWVIGMRENEFGTLERTSRIVFRRLPAYSNSDIEAADARAERIASAIKGK